MSELNKEVRGDGENSHYFKIGDRLLCTKGNRHFSVGETYVVGGICEDRFDSCKVEADEIFWLITKEAQDIIAEFGRTTSNAYFELKISQEEEDMKDSLIINNKKVRLLGTPNGLEIYETLENRDKVMYVNQNGKPLLRIDISCDKNSDVVDVNFS